ncbi:MAG: hypothetical protein XXXJIFNMEKO3_01908 [Candidatus Erwinia impunctatus]|nr:hypothetical protein XXXJIFNMEKO_01908 [Culicoides impunctatus]
MERNGEGTTEIEVYNGITIQCVMFLFSIRHLQMLL